MSSSDPFFDPNHRQAQAASVFIRLDQQDKDLNELKSDMKSVKKIVYEIKTQYKILIAMGSMLVGLGGVIAWLLENHYLSVQVPH